jgi:four helix bundle protein
MNADYRIKTQSAPWWQQIERDVDCGAESMVVREGPPADGQKPPFDLVERVALFGERIVRFSKTIPRNPTNNRLIDQLVGAGTSTGANYCEANEAVSQKDFKTTLGRCLKEGKETKFFLRMVVASEPQLADEARPLYREAHELLRIFGAMRKR